MLPSYTTRRCSRTHQQRRTAPFASYQCQQFLFLMCFASRRYKNFLANLRNKELGCQPKYYPCCGKSICIGCIRSIVKSENDYKCPFCNSDRVGKTDEEMVEEMRKRVEANDPVSICLLANSYHHGSGGLQQDIGQRQWNFTLRQRSLGTVMRIASWVRCMMKGEI